MAESRPTVGDLIDVPDLRTVVRLVEIDDAREASSLTGSFVFTDDAARALRLLQRSFAEATGQGFFLIGSYGSGKSHLLAVLALWAEAEPSQQPIPPPLEPALLTPIVPRRLLTVRCSLIDHRGDDPLEQCVLMAAERRLERLERTVALTPTGQHLSRLREALGGAERAQLDVELSSRGLPGFDELAGRSPREAIARGREFLAREGIELPAQLHDERPQLFARLVDESRACGFDGVLIVIDELSEFLRSKPTSGALSEDARFLQFLGELGREQPVWVVASLQEALEETGDLARPVLDKIKDRYPLRLSLTTTHVEDLVAGRIVRRKPGADAVLATLYARLKSHYPDLELSRERFTRLYPLHPRTLEYLEGLTELFSQARGVVEFVTTRLRGDSLRGIPGLLTEDAAALLGVDAIFDHFEGRIREHESYSPFHRKAYAHLARRCEQLFPDDEQRRTALRVLKLLVLTEINPLEGRKTVKELAELLLTQVSDLDPALNYSWLEETVLAPLYESSDYLRREAGDEPFEDRYGLDLQLDVRALMTQRVRARLDASRGDEPRRLRRLLTAVGVELPPFDRLLPGEPVGVTVPWLHTEREGALVLGEPAELDPERLAQLLAELDAGARAFVVFVREPAREPLPLPSIAARSGVLLWTPAPIEADAMAELLAASARRELRRELTGSTEEELRLRELVDEEIDKEKARLKEQLTGLYLSGALTPAVTRDGLVALEVPPSARRLEEALQPAVGRTLGERHPEFRRIMPQVDYASPRAMAQALSALAEGSLPTSQARARNLLTVIEGVLLPLGLLRLRRNSYVLEPEETPGSLVHELMARVAEAESHDRAGLVRYLTTGPFGLTPALADTVLLGLVLSGHLLAHRNDKPVAPQHVSLETLGSIETLSLGELLDEERREELDSLQFLLKGPLPEFWGIRTQQEVWQSLLAFKKRTAEHLERLRQALGRYRDVAALEGFDWARFERCIERQAELAAAIHPGHDSRHGIEAALDGQARVRLEPATLTEAKAVDTFFAGEVEKLLFLHGYVLDPTLDKLPEPWHESVRELRANLDELSSIVFSGTFAQLVERFESFRDGYRKDYAAAHAVQVGSARFADLEKLREDPAFVALANLALIAEVAVQNDHAQIEAARRAATARRCDRDPAADVFTRPTCACGFRLGEKVERPSAASLRARAREGIVEYAGALHVPDRRSRLARQAQQLLETDRKSEGHALNGLVEALDRGADADELIRLVDRTVATAMKAALSGKAVVVERNLRALVTKLTGRKLTADQLRQEFDRWLASGELEAGSYLHLIDRE